MSVKNTDTIETTIDGAVWSINPFTTTVGGNYLKRLLKVFGESYTALTTAESEEAALQVAVSKLIENIDKDDVMGLIKAMLYDVYKDGKAVNFELEFSRRYKVLFQVVKWVVKENFGDFFTGNAIGE